MFRGERACRQLVLVEVLRFEPALLPVEQKDPGRPLNFKITARSHTIHSAVVFKQNVIFVLLVGDRVVDRLELFAVRASLLVEHDHPWYIANVLVTMIGKIIAESVCIEYDHVL